MLVLLLHSNLGKLDLYYRPNIYLLLLNHLLSHGGEKAESTQAPQKRAAHTQSCLLQWFTWKAQDCHQRRFESGTSRSAVRRATHVTAAIFVAQAQVSNSI